jgi:hypothetical protein
MKRFMMGFIALLAGYRAMAADGAREADASEWINALAGDSADETR